MLERRRHDRRRAFAAGIVGHRRHGGTTDCVVRDLSEGGALLLVDEPRRAPVAITRALRGEPMAARVVWRGDLGIGVAFAPAPPAAPTTVVSLDEVRRARGGGEGRLAERIARFVRRPGPA